MKVFYSWQSDLENKYNRGFIKEALEQVVKKLNVSLNIEERLELDHDTKNVTGTPDLAATIFEKIEKSTVFIADISFIAKRTENERKCANPNVLIELGYALSKLGSDRVICILNTATGSTSDLPFDLRHKRHPVQYELYADSSNKSTQKKNLIDNLSLQIKPILDLDRYKNEKIILPINPSRNDIFNAILASDSKDDWTRLSVGMKETVYYNANVHLRLETAYNEDGTFHEDFNEPWAKKHPDPHSTAYWCHLYYDSTQIESFILVSVDGGRARLPLPYSREDLTVSILNYKIAQIHDSLGTLDRYMARSGIRVES